MSAPLGFNNTYALAVTAPTAKRHSLKTISDLKRFQDRKLGFSNEFMDRGDGWPALKRLLRTAAERRRAGWITTLRIGGSNPVIST